MEMGKHRRQKGSISIEIAVSIALFMVLAASSVQLVRSFARLNNHLWKRHTCFAAGQAQMDAIRITGEPIEPKRFESLWPGVDCKITASDGTGPWQGLQKIRLELSIKDETGRVEVELICCIEKKERQQ